MTMIDKSDILWCLENKSIENLHIEDIVDCGFIWSGLSSVITEGLISIAKKRRIEQCIEYIACNTNNCHEVDVILFDYIMLEYAWQMGGVYWKSVHTLGQIKRVGGAIKRWLSSELGYWNAWQICLNNPYCQVPKVLSIHAFVILTNIHELHKILTKEEYGILLKKYCLLTHVLYEQLLSPKEYVYQGNMLQILLHNVDTLGNYYWNKYKKWSLLQKFESDYVKILV